MIVEFEVPGVPVPKGRPRMTMRGGFPRAYTPADTRHAEAVVGTFAKIHFKEPLTEPVEIVLHFGLPIPKTSKAKESDWHAKRPDIDNLVKTVLDALNGIAYKDDGQISRLVAIKFYTKEPKTTIWITTNAP